MEQLRWTLRLNVATCALFGFLFLLFPVAVSAFLGAFPLLLLKIVGAALVIHSVHLLEGSLRKEMLAMEVYYFSAGDLLWFLGSLILLVGTGYVTTVPGVIVTLLVAFLVAGIGLSQLWHLSAAQEKLRADKLSADHLPAHYSLSGAIAASWLGLKPWVKIWLFALNIVFLAALHYWPLELAKVVLAAYVAAAPLLLAPMIVQRGLTRLLGVAHLIPWLPLFVYITLRLVGGVAGPQLTYQDDGSLFIYAGTLLVFMAICLAFDIYDLARWVNGDRARMGSGSHLVSRQVDEVPA